MGNEIDLETFDVEKFARSLEKDCQEGVKWERRKLEWILEEEKKQAHGKNEAA
jgi:hypothetical protein